MFEKNKFYDLSYNEIFDHRARKYHEAMVLYPNARNQEFYKATSHISENGVLHIADVPAGAGYLKRYLPKNCNYLSHESCDGFLAIEQQHQPTTKKNLLPLPWPAKSVDFLVSIAGLHHMQDKLPIFKEFGRVVRSEGKLILLDVLENSNVARFLDDYIGQNNSTDHQGIYLNENSLNELRILNWHIEHAKITNFYWVFKDRLNMAIFCHLLFDIRHVDYQKTIDAIEFHLGVEELSKKEVGMNWSLYKIIARRV